MSDRENLQRDYNSRPPARGESRHRHSRGYYDDPEYVVLDDDDDRHRHQQPRSSNASIRGASRSQPTPMYAPHHHQHQQGEEPSYDVEVVYDDDDDYEDYEEDERIVQSERSPPQRRRRRSVSVVREGIPRPPLPPASVRVNDKRDWVRERDHWELDHEIIVEEERRRRSPPDPAKHPSMMVHPPTSMYPSSHGALVARKASPAATAAGVTVYEYGDRSSRVPSPLKDYYEGRVSTSTPPREHHHQQRGNEYAYTRDDGVVVVRSQPQEIEIVEEVVPVPVQVEVPIRAKSRGGRSKSRGVRRKKSLDMRGAESPPPYKRLVVACDGTWLNSDNGMANGELAVPSNVTRISRALKPMSRDGIPQIVYYHFGVGSRGGVVNRVISGSTGIGLEENVREAYSFLSNNYSPGDEIYLLGFSRGAFTARSIAGLIDNIGVLTKKGLGSFVAIFEDVQHRRNRLYKDKNPDIPFSNKPNAGDPAYRRELEARGMTTLGVRVRAIGVWDTVGSLGAPRIGWLTRVGLQPMQSKPEMCFFDTKLSNCIDYAFQALALDERRASFAPALWEKPRDNSKTVLRQVWFPGVHGNVGGGYDDQQLANISLAWMVSQLQPFLDFKVKHVLDQVEPREAHWQPTPGSGSNRRRSKESLRPWSFGSIPNSAAGIYSLAGSARRTPGLYTVTDPHTGRSTGKPLRETCEYIHASVRARWKLDGPGVEDKGKYDPEPLEDWRLMVEYPDDERQPDVFWRLRSGRGEEEQQKKGQGGKRPTVSTRILPEAPLGRLERELAKRDPETYEYVMWPPRTKTRRGGGGRARSKSRGRALLPSRERMSMVEPRDREGGLVREDVVRERRRRSAVRSPQTSPTRREYRRSMPERLV